jgi:hypothetical protein
MTYLGCGGTIKHTLLPLWACTVQQLGLYFSPSCRSDMIIRTHCAYDVVSSHALVAPHGRMRDMNSLLERVPMRNRTFDCRMAVSPRLLTNSASSGRQCNCRQPCEVSRVCSTDPRIRKFRTVVTCRGPKRFSTVYLAVSLHFHSIDFIVDTHLGRVSGKSYPLRESHKLD